MVVGSRIAFVSLVVLAALRADASAQAAPGRPGVEREVRARMKRRVVHLLTILAVLIALVAPALAQSPGVQTLNAYVTRVVDGDTIYAVIGDRIEAIRYIGINTPETHHPRLGAQPGGQAATEVNRQLVDGKWIQLTLDVQHRDKYGRLLAYVWISGQMVNAQLVHRGYAQAATYPPNVRYADWLRQIERGAREGQRGLWGDPQAEVVMRQVPGWARGRSQQAVTPQGRQLLPGEIPPQEPIRFKTPESDAPTTTFSSSGTAVAPSATGSDRSVNVHGYTRGGTYVAPHTRSAPDGRR